MRKDAFDDLACPFDYNAEITLAREALHERIGAYISENQHKSYRKVAEEFGISTAAVCEIAKRYARKRKRGRTSAFERFLSVPEKVTFNVRHKIGEKELQTVVTVKKSGLLQEQMASRDIKSDPLELMRDAVARYFKTRHVTIGDDLNNERRAEYTYDELWR